MQFLMLFKPDFTSFDAKIVENAFRQCSAFTNLRLDEPGGAMIECKYTEPSDWTIIRLSGDAQAISVDHTWGAALQAALLIQRALGFPLRMFNDDNTFDLTFSDIATVKELEAAIEKASMN